MAKAPLYAAIKLLFPPECYHCRAQHEKLGTPLCQSCFSHLEPRPPVGEILITFEMFSPAQSLITALKKGFSSKLSSTLAAYMAMQYAKSELPLPDLITAVPTSTWRKWQMGEESAGALAKEFAQFLERPFKQLLRRKKQLLRQNLLSHEERRDLETEEFEWKEKQNMHGKTILIMDDTITTGATLACCAEKLWESSPAKIIKMVCVDRGYLKE